MVLLRRSSLQRGFSRVSYASRLNLAARVLSRLLEALSLDNSAIDFGTLGRNRRLLGDRVSLDHVL